MMALSLRIDHSNVVYNFRILTTEYGVAVVQYITLNKCIISSKKQGTNSHDNKHLNRQHKSKNA